MISEYKIEGMVGKTPKEVVNTEDEIVFEFTDGCEARFYHCQDCCEVVSIEDICGDWSDLIGHPLLVAEERISYGEDQNDSETWTFYTFRGLGGSVDVRWYGWSNGCYSESVDFEMTCP